jgi:glycosyltransferase involved in cell wall biosynthesis
VRYVSVAYTHAPTDPRVRRHCETLARRGWRVYQLGIGAPGEQQVGRLNNVLLVRWLRPRYRGGRLLRYLWSYCSFFLWVRKILARLGRDGTVRIVQVNNIPTFLVWAATGARRRGARLVLDIHDPEPELFLSKFGHRIGATLVFRVLRKQEILAAASADRVLCVHEQHRAVTVAHGVDARKLHVVLNYADERIFQRRPPRPAVPFVAYHGTVAGRMGLDMVLRGIALASGEWPTLRGAIWGDGDAVAELMSLRDALQLRDTVEIPGKRFRLEDLLPRFETVGLGIVPLRRDVFTDVMLPTKIIEYVRLGIPVIVSWTPTIGYYFPEDTVFYIRSLSPAAVATAIGNALANPEEASERARRAQALPVARSWQQNEQEYVNMLCEAVG